MRIRQTHVAPGAQGTRETLNLMVSVTREAVRDSRFQEFAQHFDGMTPAEIDTQVRQVYTYVDEEIETLYSPLFNMARWLNGFDVVGDCDDVSMFLAAIFTALGYQSRFVAMQTKRNDPLYYHVVVEVKDGGKWKRFDPTVMQGLVQVDYGQMVIYV